MPPTNPLERLASNRRLTAIAFAALAVLGQAGVAAAGGCASSCGGP